VSDAGIFVWALLNAHGVFGDKFLKLLLEISNHTF
jgi:hypothetical protein